jgi:hypothetical protein
MDALARVRRATATRARLIDRETERWRETIRQAVAEGHSQRAVGEAAGVTHTRVQQILRGG